ncbi:hypothetical protein CPB97_008408 [Podila verticillata]|nr:hypothetical protein CPB97_008408 [Podila verticillata]
MASAIASRLDGLSEITELEKVPLPYKTLYHTLVLKNDMPVDLLKERHQTGSEQLLTWIQAALKLVDTVIESQLLQRSQRREDNLEFLDDDEESDQEELEIEIQDVVSGFGHYEPTIESSIEILLQLEECISNRTTPSDTPKDAPSSPSSLSVTSSSLSLSSMTSLSGSPLTHLSPEIEQVMEQWSRLRGIIGGLGGSVREQQRIRDGIQSVNNIAEQTYQAAQLLEKCLKAIAQDKQNCRLAFEKGLTQPIESKGGLDGNDMLELDSRVGLLSLQIESLQTSFPECASANNNKTHYHHKHKIYNEQDEGLANKKKVMASLYQDLLTDWNSLRRRKEQLWRDLEECDRWRARIEKMARQIESMLDPVEIFHKMCFNLLVSLEEKDPSKKHLMAVNEEDQVVHSPKPESLSSWPSIVIEEPSPADLEMIATTLQELEEKQNMVAPAIENMFWVQEGEIQHRTKNVAHSPSTPSTAVPPSPHSPLNTFAGSPPDFSSPLYPNLPMLERQRGLKARWSNLKSSLDTVGTQLQQHHTTLTERVNAFSAMKKRQAEEAAEAAARAAEEKARISTEAFEPSTPTLQRSFTSSSQRSSSVMSSGWNSSTRILRGTLVPSLSMDSPTVKKYMLLKSDKPASNKTRPWCPSMNTQSPGMPGFPMQTSSWGYFLISTSQSMDSFGSIIATPAPLPIAPPPAPTPPPKTNRPPFSPAGTRRYTKPTPPTRPAPQRSVSVSGGDYNRNRCMSPTISWENKMVRRSNSMAFDDNNNNRPAKGAKNTRQGSNSQNKSRRQGSISSTKDASGHANRRFSNASESSSTWYGNHHHRHSIDTSSSEDETVTGEFHTNNRLSHGYKHFNKQGLRARTKQNDSSSSLDSMMSSGNSYGGRGYSSLSSHGELRSPSPPLPLPYPSAFGSSFTAARSTAALHTALLSSMSSHSSASFRNSALSFSSSQRTDSRQSEHDGVSSKHSSGVSLSRRHHDNKPSSWIGGGSLISALSFRVPTYSFEEDFGSFESTAHEGAIVS